MDVLDVLGLLPSEAVVLGLLSSEAASAMLNLRERELAESIERAKTRERALTTAVTEAQPRKQDDGGDRSTAERTRRQR